MGGGEISLTPAARAVIIRGGDESPASPLRLTQAAWPHRTAHRTRRGKGARMSVAALGRHTRAPHPVEQGGEPKFEYPGIPTTCDGAEAVVHVEIAVCQAAGAYPITSSTTMGGGFNAAVMNGATNLWGDPLMFFEPESEHSAATVCEGFAVAGGRVTNFTSGQGLVLMKGSCTRSPASVCR